MTSRISDILLAIVSRISDRCNIWYQGSVTDVTYGDTGFDRLQTAVSRVSDRL